MAAMLYRIPSTHVQLQIVNQKAVCIVTTCNIKVSIIIYTDHSIFLEIRYSYTNIIAIITFEFSYYHASYISIKLRNVTLQLCDSRPVISLVSRSQTTFFLLYSDGKKPSEYKRKKWSGYARL